jgi:hypothetical protein
VVLEARQHRRRQQPQPFIVCLGLDDDDERQFAGVIGVLARHRLEGVMQRLDLDEVELEPIGFHLPTLERQRVRIVAEADAKGGHLVRIVGRDNMDEVDDDRSRARRKALAGKQKCSFL